MDVSGAIVAIVLLLACCVCVSPVRVHNTASNLLSALQHYRSAGDPFIRATCELQSNSALPAEVREANDVQGTVTFRQLDLPSEPGRLHVSVRLTGLDESSTLLHGFHVHENGDLTGGCGATGGHFNPTHKLHGGPNDAERHVGDFGNVARQSDGSVSYDFTDGVASLLGTNTIIGRAIVLHQDTDDLGTGGHSDSLTTGHAGARLACCIIQRYFAV